VADPGAWNLDERFRKAMLAQSPAATGVEYPGDPGSRGVHFAEKWKIFRRLKADDKIKRKNTRHFYIRNERNALNALKHRCLGVYFAKKSEIPWQPWQTVLAKFAQKLERGREEAWKYGKSGVLTVEAFQRRRVPRATPWDCIISELLIPVE
jgi:hypothetical protein